MVKIDVPLMYFFWIKMERVFQEKQWILRVWSEEIGVTIFDYSNPGECFETINFTHNDALSLEGEWSKNSDIHTEILKYSMHHYV
jgi:hypothetical protein